MREDPKSKIGHPGFIKMPHNNKILKFIVEDEIRMKQSNNKNKIFTLQKLKFSIGNRKELRLGYYIIGRKEGRSKGKWVWGQYNPHIPVIDFKHLIKEAKKKKFI